MLAARQCGVGGTGGGKAALEIAHANGVDFRIMAFDAADDVLGQLDRGHFLRSQSCG